MLTPFIDPPLNQVGFHLVLSSAAPVKVSSNANVQLPVVPVGCVLVGVVTVGAGSVTVDGAPSAAITGIVTVMTTP